ncbi:p-hydroxyphenylacetate 3-hydroxylase, oxygenase component [Bhargavaea cecembensis DSE10]|uniref:p-hydroxyphenylacetate 3-hydroxylase, oxygenase component n=1 Tax=Bhargavaea cecembensis DSE10 TaxID=1235279 RepID=M7P9R4_9BACL|nr:p-hydroxyphenylacetate 3-hydroxylase oxygenase component [Bhargavaea cecembensis]EMR07229.1 p-hydroxyphenylacetate 3-hydroxylase, oxygenase component [Bhargavaea cecembensis DSE10]
MRQPNVLQKPLEREELLRRAKELGELAEQHSLQSDQDGKLPDVVIEKMKEAEFHMLMRPKTYGGQELDFKTFGDIIRTVAYHSVPAAWITYFAIIHETWPAFLPKEGRDKLFGRGELMADVFAPVGQVEDADDGEGYIVSGTWNFCSGVLWCDWIALGAIHKMRDGEQPELSLFIVHKDDAEIIENWDTLGLRGTGSNAVKLDKAYVAPHMVFPISRVVQGATAPDGNYEPDYQIFNVPYLAYFLSGFAQVAIGGLNRLVDDYIEKTKGRVRIYNNKKNEKDGSSGQRNIGEIKMEFNALKNIADELLEKLQGYRADGTRVLEEEEREQLFAMRGYVAKNSAELATRIIINLGGNALYRNGQSERFVRDLIAVAAHPTHLYEDAMVGYGKTILGFDGHPMW